MVSFFNKTQSEAPGVYQALVADLARTHTPTGIMGVTLVGVGSYAYASTSSMLILIATVYGGLATAVRLWLMNSYLRSEARDSVDLNQIPSWEAWHATTVSSVATSISMICAALFLQSDLTLQMLATAIIFGYCAGVVARVAIRPQIAIMAMTIAAVPPILAASAWLDPPHIILSVIFSIFLLGSYDSVRHVHQATARHIQTQFDMAALARLDPLTNLPNRLGLSDAFKTMTANRSGTIALHYFDLDGFKKINDTFGHATGDALLSALAHRLRVLLPAGTIAARVGGDEFVILQSVNSRLGDADLLARSLCTAISEPYRLSRQEVRVGVSLGYVRTGSSVADLNALICQADEAAYSVKRTGGGVARADAFLPNNVLKMPNVVR